MYLVGKNRLMAAKRAVTLPLLAPDGSRWPCMLTLRQGRETFDRAMEFSSEQLGEERFEAGDWFDCLISLRQWLEATGWRILCNGARVNAWPSGMARSMGGGGMVYLHPGEQRQMTGDDLVRTFDEAPAELVVTVGEQLAYHQHWWRRWRTTGRPHG